MLLSLPPLPSIAVIHNGIQCRKLTVSDPVKYLQCIHSAKPIIVNYFVSFVDMYFLICYMNPVEVTAFRALGSYF